MMPIPYLEKGLRIEDVHEELGLSFNVSGISLTLVTFLSVLKFVCLHGGLIIPLA